LRKGPSSAGRAHPFRGKLSERSLVCSLSKLQERP
jgi:hypothetical protein